MIGRLWQPNAILLTMTQALEDLFFPERRHLTTFQSMIILVRTFQKHSRSLKDFDLS